MAHPLPTLPGYRFLLPQGTFAIRPALKKLGCWWDPSVYGWWVPEAMWHRALAALSMAEPYAPQVVSGDWEEQR